MTKAMMKSFKKVCLKMVKMAVMFTSHFKDKEPACEEWNRYFDMYIRHLLRSSSVANLKSIFKNDLFSFTHGAVQVEESRLNDRPASRRHEDQVAAAGVAGNAPTAVDGRRRRSELSWYSSTSRFNSARDQDRSVREICVGRITLSVAFTGEHEINYVWPSL